jgi:HAD superfamily hydrolase (TIGR01509 family)
VIKLVIFDLDGVLVDACEWHRIALNKALKEVCNYEISLEDHYKDYNGIPTKVKLNKLCEKDIIKINDFSLIEQLKQKYTIELINQTANIRQEKIDVLNYLKNKEIKTACYTNSIRQTAELMLYKTGILHLFDVILSNQDVSKPKPNPEGYIKIMNLLNHSANETLIIEDSPKGFEAAYQSGAKVFKVNDQEQVNLNLFRGYI